MFHFSQRSLDRLAPVHPELVQVMKRALELSSVDFTITEGLRDKETQAKYVAQGKSQTMNSYHLKQSDGYAHAVDVAALVDGKVSWDWKYYEEIARAVRQASLELYVRVTWGGSWASLKDGPHFQIEL